MPRENPRERLVRRYPVAYTLLEGMLPGFWEEVEAAYLWWATNPKGVVEELPSTTSVATQTTSTPVSHRGTMTDAPRRTALGSQTDPSPTDRPRLTRGTDRCWNCWSPEHRYANCPHPRNRLFCYGCGLVGHTMRTCPYCQREWVNLGPYLPSRGHLGRRDEDVE